MCDVPSVAVFCSESIECFPGIVSKFFFKLLVTIPVAPIIIIIIIIIIINDPCARCLQLYTWNNVRRVRNVTATL